MQPWSLYRRPCAGLLTLLTVAAGTLAYGQESTAPVPDLGENQADGIQLIVDSSPLELSAVSFEFETNDAIAQAFGNQMIALVRQNLQGIAEIGAPANLIDPLLGNFEVAELASADASLEDFRPTEAAISTSLAEETAPYRVAGSLRHLDGQVMEIALVVQGLSETGVQAQTLILRADSSDWHQVGHAVSNALFAMMTEKPGEFHSKVVFAAQAQTSGGEQSRLALIDQTGGALTWIPEAGTQVAHPQFLGNRFEIAFVDQSDGGNALMHFNLLSGRLTPLAQLPDLVGAPSLALGGRLIAFASTEDALDLGDLTPTDIFVADVERAVLRPISIPGSLDLDPALSPDLLALSFVSIRETWSELLIAQLNEPMGMRDRTKGSDQLEALNVDLLSLYGSPHSLHQPVWSPSGDQIAFIERRSRGQDRLLIYEFATQEVREIAKGPMLANPTWGPGGEALILVTQKPGEETGTLAKIDLSQGTLRLLAVPYDAESPSWSPRTNRPVY